jgi:hypothetical protein
VDDNRFGLARGNIDRILDWVYWGQAGWLIFVGLLFGLAPARRFGPSWQFLVAIPGGLYVAAAANIALGLMLLWAMQGHNRGHMARGMRIAGFTHWVIALLLMTGALAGPTGVVGAAYSMYVGAHMLVQSALLNTAPAR